MAKVPSVSKLLVFDALYLSDNVRTTACERIPDMVASLKRNGFKVNHPLVVSAKADGSFLVLCGNRRTKGLQFLFENDEEAFNAALSATQGKVPCIVHSGLTAEEEIVLRIDHSADEDRVPLDEYSQFLAVKQLLIAYPGESQAKIAEKLGIVSLKGKNKGKPDRSFVQVRVNLARLPLFVQNEFRKLCEQGKDSTPFRRNDIGNLYKVFGDEFAQYPDGNGPKFSAIWQGILNPAPTETPTEQGSTSEPSDLTAKSAKERSMLASSRLVKRILLAITNQGGDLPTLDVQALNDETDAQILRDIRSFLGNEAYLDLVVKARDYVAAQTPIKDERASVVADNALSIEETESVSA